MSAGPAERVKSTSTAVASIQGLDTGLTTTNKPYQGKDRSSLGPVDIDLDATPDVVESGIRRRRVRSNTTILQRVGAAAGVGLVLALGGGLVHANGTIDQQQGQITDLNNRVNDQADLIKKLNEDAVNPANARNHSEVTGPNQ